MIGRRAAAATLATAAAVLLGVCVVEAWLRLTWNPKRGTPGFFVSDPTRRQRLAPNYDGWFGGVPVHINRLGFRDSRDSTLAKAPGVFRILVLGDSVTFGHGSIYEHTYPLLLEQQLKRWRSGVEWQVWNAAVPGYNTSDELAALYDVGPRFKPDLVVIAFYANDMFDNHPIRTPGPIARTGSAALGFIQRHFYSTELYKKVALRAAWMLSRSNAMKARLEYAATEEALLNRREGVQDLPLQQITPVERFTDDQLRELDCRSRWSHKPEEVLDELTKANPGFDDWVRTVRELQALHLNGKYRIAFFINPHMVRCRDGDYFDPVGPAVEDRFLLGILSEGTPAGSAFDEFRRHRPSQMPFFDGHTVGNSNVVKATALFDFLRQQVFPSIPELAARGAPRSRRRRKGTCRAERSPSTAC